MEAYAGGAAPWGFDVNGVAHPQAYAPTVWKGDYEGQPVGSRQHVIGMDLSAGYHKCAVKWEPNKQTFYFNGVEVLTLNVTMAGPMYLMLDLWFGSASVTPNDSTSQGKTNSFEVSYGRLVVQVSKAAAVRLRKAQCACGRIQSRLRAADGLAPAAVTLGYRRRRRHGQHF